MSQVAVKQGGAVVAQTEEDLIRVLQKIEYNPKTGVFIRKVDSSWAKAGDICGATNSKGYIEFNILGKLVRAHRLAFFIMTGRWPTLTIDHIDGDKKNNRWANLREVDNKTNCENKKSINRNNTSGFTGVRAKNGGYEARIKSGGKLISLGVFGSTQQAHEMYMKNKVQLHKGYQP